MQLTPTAILFCKKTQSLYLWGVSTDARPTKSLTLQTYELT